MKNKIELLWEEIDDLQKTNAELSSRSDQLQQQLKDPVQGATFGQGEWLKFDENMADNLNEVKYWKNMCRDLVEKYFTTLVKIKEENQTIRKEVGINYKKLCGEIHEVLGQFDKPSNKV